MQDVQAMSASEKKYYENVTLDMHRAAAEALKGRKKRKLEAAEQPDTLLKIANQ